MKIYVNKYESQQRKESIINSLNNSNNNNYAAFAVCTQNNNELMFINIDAMMASQVVLKPTVNGYSSTCIDQICNFLYKPDSTSLYNWLDLKGIDKKSVLIINH